jgi:hypothetical protein
VAAGEASTQQDLTRLFTPGGKSAPSGTTANSGATDPQNDQPPFTQLLHPVPGKPTGASGANDTDPLTDTLGQPTLPGQATPYPSNHTLSNAYSTANDWLDQHSLPNLIRKAQGEPPVPANTGKLGQINTELRGAVDGVLDAAPNIAIATANEIRRDPGQLTRPSLFPGSQIVAPALKANGPNQAEGVAQTGKDIKGRYGPMIHGDVQPFVHDYREHPVRAALEDIQVPLTLVPIGRSIIGFASRGAAEAAAAREATTATNTAARAANADATHATPETGPAATGQPTPPAENAGATGAPPEHPSENEPLNGVAGPVSRGPGTSGLDTGGPEVGEPVTTGGGTYSKPMPREAAASGREPEPRPSGPAHTTPDPTDAPLAPSQDNPTVDRTLKNPAEEPSTAADNDTAGPSGDILPTPSGPRLKSSDGWIW